MKKITPFGWFLIVLTPVAVTGILVMNRISRRDFPMPEAATPVQSTKSVSSAEKAAEATSSSEEESSPPVPPL